MTDPRYDRFRRLERPRSAGPEPAATPSGTGSRIEAVRGPQSTPAAEPPSEAADGAAGHLDRFRPEPERGLELDLSDHDSQPFIRCSACETDNFRAATRCTTCGADLDTDPQRDFNRRFWAARKAEAAAEAEASAARRVVLEEDRTRDTEMARQAAESMAREVGDAERRRLEREGFAPGWTGPDVEDLLGGGRPATPLAFRLLRSLPPGWPAPVGLALVALPVGLYLLRPLVGLATGAVLLILFLPQRRRTWFDSWLDR